MAAPTNTITTYAAVGNREDLSDLIYTLKTDDTPFLNMLKRTKATATYHEWQTDVLGAGDPTNAFIEGNDFVGTAFTPTVRIGNRTQISKKEPLVSGTQEAVSSAGRASDMAFQKAKMMRQLKQDMETILTGNQAAVVGDGTTARKLRSLEAWYVTNTNRGAGGANGSASTAATDGTQRAFTETMIKDVAQKAFQNGGDPSVLMVGPFNRGVFSSFTAGSTKFTATEDKTLTATITVYEGDFSTLKVVSNRFQRARTAHIIDPNYWAIAELRPLFSEPLGKTGDNTKEQMIIEYTLESQNEAASGVVADLLTA